VQPRGETAENAGSDVNPTINLRFLLDNPRQNPEFARPILRNSPGDGHEFGQKYWRGCRKKRIQPTKSAGFQLVVQEKAPSAGAA
jgi:hypothetical protein